MLTVSSSRRDFLRVGALGVGGLTLPDILRLQAATPPAGRSREKAVIFVYLFGSVVSKMRRGDVRALPPYVALDKTAGDEYRNGPAYLGVSHKAFIATGKLEGLALPRNVTVDRLEDRTQLM